MHIGLIVDDERLLHERPMLNRLTLGLVDEGAQVTRLVPEHAAGEDLDEQDGPVDMVTSRIGVRSPVAVWMRPARARRLAAALDRAVPDVLYAVGTKAWPLARDLRDELERPFVLNVWCQAQARGVPSWRDEVAGFVVPTEPMSRTLAERVDPGLISIVTPGVPTPPQPREILAEPDAAISLAIIGSGRDAPMYRALLAALSGIVREMPQVQAVLELRGPSAHAVWREAQRLDLLGHLSAITDAAPLRTLLTGCDVLIMPERYGELRTLTLEGMASGMAVVCATDRALDMLADDETALTVSEASPEAWSRQLRRVLSDPPFARRLGRGAHDRVRAMHGTCEQVRGLIATMDRVLGGDSYSFADAAG